LDFVTVSFAWYFSVLQRVNNGIHALNFSLEDFTMAKKKAAKKAAPKKAAKKKKKK
jgi:hypothetical protein